MRHTIERHEHYVDSISYAELWLEVQPGMNCVYTSEDMEEKDLLMCFSRQENARKYITKKLLEERRKYLKELSNRHLKERILKENV